MLRNHSITTINYVVTYYQILVEVVWALRLKKHKNDKIFLKKMKFHKKIAKSHDVKMLKTLLLQLEAMQ